MGEESRANPGGTGMVVAGLITIFLGLWMVGRTMASEGEVIKIKLNGLSAQVEGLQYQVRELERTLRKQQQQTPAAKAAPSAEPAPTP